MSDSSLFFSEELHGLINFNETSANLSTRTLKLLADLSGDLSEISCALLSFSLSASPKFEIVFPLQKVLDVIKMRKELELKNLRLLYDDTETPISGNFSVTSLEVTNISAVEQTCNLHLFLEKKVEL